MVPLERIELSTSPLPRVCSATEPQRRLEFGAHIATVCSARQYRALKFLKSEPKPTLKKTDGKIYRIPLKPMLKMSHDSAL